MTAELRFTADQVRISSFEHLFIGEKMLRDEVNRRAWEVLKALGYEWYSTRSISVIMVKRGKVDIVEIKATIENHRVESEIKAEMPLKQFEMLLQRDFEA